MSLTGNENAFQHYNNQATYFQGTYPYHYFELWLTNLLFKLNPFISTVVVTKYISYPLLKTLGIWGIWAILKDRDKNQFYLIPFIALLSTIPLHQILDLAGNSWGIYTDIWIRPNFITYFLFLIPTIFFIQNKQFYTLIIWLIFLPLVSTTTAPAIYASLIVFIAMLRLKKKLTIKQTAQLASIVILSAGLILLFYLLTSSILSSSADNPKGTVSLLATITKLWKAIIFMSITLSLRVALFAGIITGLAYLFFKNNVVHFKTLLHFSIVSFVLSLMGILVFQILPTVDNTYQFPYVGYLSLHLLTMYFLILLISKKESRILPFLIILPSLIWAGLNLYRASDSLAFKSPSTVHYNLEKRGYSNESISTLKAYFNKHPNAQGAFYISKETLADTPPKKRHALTFQPGDEVNYLINYSTLLPITPDSILYPDYQHEPEAHTKAKSFNKQLPSHNLINNKSIEYSLKALNCDFLVSTGSIQESFLTPITQTAKLFYYEVSIP